MPQAKLTQPLIVVVIIAVLGTAGYYGYKEIRQAISGGAGAKLQSSSEFSAELNAGGTQTYTHPDYGFTLHYPSSLTLGNFPEGDGEIVLLQSKTAPSASSGRAQEGFQIFISPYTEKEDFSKEVIKKAAPEMKIENDQTITLGTEGLTALAFDSENESGKTHEIWFVVDGNLYQCTSYKDYGGKMEEVLKTISFN